MAAWLATQAGGWRWTWWMTCAFATLGGLFSLYLCERRLGIPVRGPFVAGLYERLPRSVACSPGVPSERPESHRDGV